MSSPIDLDYILHHWVLEPPRSADAMISFQIPTSKSHSVMTSIFFFNSPPPSIVFACRSTRIRSIEMSFFNRLPRWEAVVQQAGVGQDPFRYLMNSVEQIAYPKTPNSVFGILLGFAGVYLIAILVCFSLLLIPVVQGPEARKRHFWLYKKQHLPGSKLIILTSSVSLIHKSD